MATSQNGWSASANLKTRVIEPVEGVKLRVRDDDDVAYALGYVAAQWHKRVESLVGKVTDDWGFAFRANRNDPDSLSNHSSGTAIDLNAVQHPNGVATSRTFSAKEAAEIREIVAEFDGALRWGGDYRGTPDAMHVEVNATKAKLAAAVKKHKAAHGAKPEPKPAPSVKSYPTLSRGDVHPILVPFLKRYFGLAHINENELFGAGTELAVVKFQKKNKLAADGVVGPKTWAAIAKGGTLLPPGWSL